MSLVAAESQAGLLPEQLLRTGAVVVDTGLRLVAILERRVGYGVDTADTRRLRSARAYRLGRGLIYPINRSSLFAT